MIQRIQRPSRPEFRPGAYGVRAVLLALVLGLGTSSCTPVGVSQREPAPVPPSAPSILAGHLPAALEEEAASALAEARRLLQESSFEEARTAALGIIQYYPGAVGSSEALSIQAQAAIGLGRTDEAVEVAGQYLSLFQPGHPGFPEALLLASRASALNGDPSTSVANLLLIPTDAAPETLESGVDLLRDVVGSMGTERLREVTGIMDRDHPFRGVLVTELAVSLFLRGDTAEARSLAETALTTGLGQRELELSRGILDGDLEDVMGQPVVLGAILPRSGVSPGLVEYGEWVLEGIQVAVEEFQGELRRPVRLEVFDHEGSAAGNREAVLALEESGAIGAVAPLSQDFFAISADARRAGLPMISPFATLPLEDSPGVLSLSGPDPGGAEELARYAWDLGLERVVVLRPGTEEGRLEGEAFERSYQELGGIIPREVVYDSGATFFQAEFDLVGSLLPDGLFLPLAPSDIRVLAPQFTYYGLDTLGIQLLGTSGWTVDEVVLEVDSRHTDGVVASTTRLSQDETEAFQRFRTRYEALFQKSLRSEVPAYGYDAASLLLEALRAGPRNSEELLRSMREIRDYPGATGHLSVDGDRIRRVPQLVRIQNHELIYITSHSH